MIKDESVLVKYSEIWYKFKELIGKKLHRKPAYDDKYINISKIISLYKLPRRKDSKRRYALRLV